MFRPLNHMNNIYDNVSICYLEKGMSIPEACTHLGISISNYYKICKKLGKDSIASIKKYHMLNKDIQNESSKSRNQADHINQVQESFESGESETLDFFLNEYSLAKDKLIEANAIIESKDLYIKELVKAMEYLGNKVNELRNELSRDQNSSRTHKRPVLDLAK